MNPTYGLFIDGASHEACAGATFEVENPATRQTLCEVAEGRAEDVQVAVAAASSAFHDGRWSGLSSRERARVLNRIAARLAADSERFAGYETLQTGRPIREMKAQVGRTAEWLEYYAALTQTVEGQLPDFGPGFLNYVVREPVGVAGLITPWNHPLQITVRKAAAALATGNTAVVKPSELAPVSILEFAALCTDEGLPPGVLNVITGFGSRAGRAIAEHLEVSLLDLTGGTETGRIVAEAAGRKLAPVSAELGGKAPVLVFDDADLDAAAAGVTFGSFIATGQSCIAAARVLVHESCHEELVRALVARAELLHLGDPMDPATDVGPLVSSAQLARVSRAVDDAREAGAVVHCGGGGSEDAGPGYFYRPTILGSVTTDMEIWRQEVFGPVMIVRPFADETEAIELANDSEFGLGAGIWTRDVGRAHRVARQIQAGVIFVNDHHRTAPASPWGGYKSSSIGREQGLEAYRFYTQTKSVIVRTAAEPFDWYADRGGRYP